MHDAMNIDECSCEECEDRVSDIRTNERLPRMVDNATLALRFTPESHVHPSLRVMFDDAELVRRTIAALPDDANPNEVHVVSWTSRTKRGQTALHRVREHDLVVSGIRGGRTVASRIVLGREAPYTSTVTVVVGPHEGLLTVFAAYWGESAPREPGDPSLDDAGRAESESFWSEHALVPEHGEQTVINLTPHALHVAQPESPDGERTWRTVPASGEVARVVQRARRLPATILGAPVELVEYGDVKDLPDAQDGVVFVVSGMVRSSLGSTRPDVVSPGAIVRDRDGVVIGCLAFVGIDS